MADLDKSGIELNEVLSASDITNLYDALTGDTTFDNVRINTDKVFRAHITQSGTDDPTFMIYTNTLDSTPTISRNEQGVYEITIDTADYVQLTSIKSDRLLSADKQSTKIIINNNDYSGNAQDMCSADIEIRKS